MKFSTVVALACATSIGCSGIRETERFEEKVVSERRVVQRKPTPAVYRGRITPGKKLVMVDVVQTPQCNIAVEQEVRRTRIVERTSAPPHEGSVKWGLGAGIPLTVIGGAFLAAAPFLDSKAGTTTNSIGQSQQSVSPQTAAFVAGGVLAAVGLPLTIIGIVDAARQHNSRERPSVVRRLVPTRQTAECNDEPAPGIEIVAVGTRTPISLGRTNQNGQLAVPLDDTLPADLCYGTTPQLTVSLGSGQPVGTVDLRTRCSDVERAEFAAAKASDNADELRRFVIHFPSGEHSGEAGSRLNTIDDEKAWSDIDLAKCQRPASSHDCDAVQAYAVAHPRGAHLNEAKAILNSPTLAAARRREDAQAKAEERERARQAEAEQKKREREAQEQERELAKLKGPEFEQACQQHWSSLSSQANKAVNSEESADVHQYFQANDDSPKEPGGLRGYTLDQLKQRQQAMDNIFDHAEERQRRRDIGDATAFNAFAKTPFGKRCVILWQAQRANLRRHFPEICAQIAENMLDTNSVIAKRLVFIEAGKRLGMEASDVEDTCDKNCNARCKCFRRCKNIELGALRQNCAAQCEQF